MATIQGAKSKTDIQLEDEAIADAVRTFIGLQSRVWVRQQKNAILPVVLRMADDLRANGEQVDVPAILKQVWLERDGIVGLLD